MGRSALRSVRSFRCDSLFSTFRSPNFRTCSGAVILPPTFAMRSPTLLCFSPFSDRVCSLPLFLAVSQIFLVAHCCAPGPTLPLSLHAVTFESPSRSSASLTPSCFSYLFRIDLYAAPLLPSPPILIFFCHLSSPLPVRCSLELQAVPLFFR